MGAGRGDRPGPPGGPGRHSRAVPARLPIVAGLLPGVLAGAWIVVAIMLLAPDPAPSAPVRTASPAASPAPLASPSLSSSPAPGSASATAASANFHVGQA